MREQPSIEQLFKAGAHFGHARRNWNPRMSPYIFTTKDRIDIIDLDITAGALKEACNMAYTQAQLHNRILFVGTKRAARELVAEQAARCEMPYVDHRWLGGTLTNWKTVRSSIKRLGELQEDLHSENAQAWTKKERLVVERNIAKLRRNFAGIRDIGGLPDMLFVVDVHHERIAVSEARKMGIPVVGIVDTNSDPRSADHVIPMNDDSHRALRLVVSALADACLDGKAKAAPLPESQKKDGVQIERVGTD